MNLRIMMKEKNALAYSRAKEILNLLLVNLKDEPQTNTKSIIIMMFLEWLHLTHPKRPAVDSMLELLKELRTAYDEAIQAIENSRNGGPKISRKRPAALIKSAIASGINLDSPFDSLREDESSEQDE